MLKIIIHWRLVSF